MISGRKVGLKRITMAEEIVRRLGEPHAIPVREPFKEVDHETVGYLNALADTNKAAAAFSVDLPFDMAPDENTLRAMIDRAPLFTHTEGAGPYDGDSVERGEDLTYIRQEMMDGQVHKLDIAMTTRDIWRVLFEKYRLLDAMMLVKRRDEIHALFNLMINVRQSRAIPDSLFDEFVEDRNRPRRMIGDNPQA